MRSIIASMNMNCMCHNDLQIFIPSLMKEELKSLIHFLNVGEILCHDQANVVADLNEIFGFPQDMLFMHINPTNADETKINQHFSTFHSPEFYGEEIDIVEKNDFKKDLKDELEEIQKEETQHIIVNGNISPQVQIDYSSMEEEDFSDVSTTERTMESFSIPKKDFSKKSVKVALHHIYAQYIL